MPSPPRDDPQGLFRIAQWQARFYPRLSESLAAFRRNGFGQEISRPPLELTIPIPIDPLRRSPFLGLPIGVDGTGDGDPTTTSFSSPSPTSGSAGSTGSVPSSSSNVASSSSSGGTTPQSSLPSASGVTPTASSSSGGLPHTTASPPTDTYSGLTGTGCGACLFAQYADYQGQCPDPYINDEGTIFCLCGFWPHTDCPVSQDNRCPDGCVPLPDCEGCPVSTWSCCYVECGGAATLQLDLWHCCCASS